MVWRVDDPQGNEAAKVKYEIVQYTRGVGLDLGCGPSKAFPHFIGVDNCVDTKLFGIKMRPDLVVDDCADLGRYVQDASVDFIFSSHLLEHIADYKAALRDWWRCIKPGGHLVLYLPHRDLYPNIGQPGANPDHRWDFCPEDISGAMAEFASFDLVVNERRAEGCEYSFLQVYRKNRPGDTAIRSSYLAERPKKTVCVVRYGGFGDQLQAANILPELKRQGYRVTFMTTPKGQDVLRHDPHIDEFFIQDPDQVPNHELVAFWEVQAHRFDKFINLSESVEATLLAMPGRTNHAWPDTVRRRELGRNYLEFTSMLAELPYHSESRFYASPAEDSAAASYLDERGGDGVFHVLWALAGSSIHKFYPWQDQAIAHLLDLVPNIHITLVGDEACKILECGWEENPRVTCRSGEMGIRETLTLAQHVDCVVGPETGVLNAVAFESVGKVILLSHSSRENLTKHWVNCDTLEPENTPCYPCHRLHYGREYCHEHAETGAAICQANIPTVHVVDAIMHHYSDWKLLRSVRRSFIDHGVTV